MPNHVVTRFTTSPEVAAAITYPSEDSTVRVVDFALLIPQPPNIETGHCSNHHAPGVVCWHAWSIENWGTKWNAYNSKVAAAPGDLCVVEFQTAWSHPWPVMDALSKKFPDEPIVVEYADEDLGQNVGRYTARNGSAEGGELSGTAEGRELAVRLHWAMTVEEYDAWLNEDMP